MELERPKVEKVTVQVKDNKKSKTKALSVYNTTIEEVFDKIETSLSEKEEKKEGIQDDKLNTEGKGLYN